VAGVGTDLPSLYMDKFARIFGGQALNHRRRWNSAVRRPFGGGGERQRRQAPAAPFEPPWTLYLGQAGDPEAGSHLRRKFLMGSLRGSGPATTRNLCGKSPFPGRSIWASTRSRKVSMP